MWQDYGMARYLLTITYAYFSLFSVGVLSTHAANPSTAAVVHDM